MLSPLILSLVRTGVPALVGALVSWLLLTFGLEVPDDLVVEATAAATGIALMLYYIAARWLEQRVPALSWLLGSPARPVVYERPDGALSVEVEPQGRHRAT